MSLPLLHLARKVRRIGRRRGPKQLLPVLLLLSASAHAQTAQHGGPVPAPPVPYATVQNYDTTTVSWTLPAGMSHRTARQAVATLMKMGATQDKSRLTSADSSFLYKWMPGVLEPARGRRPQ